jgi:hypothetical protein
MRTNREAIIFLVAILISLVFAVAGWDLDTRTSPPDTGTRPNDTGNAQVAQSVEQGTEKPGSGAEAEPPGRDDVEAALAYALRAATASGQWTAVTELARALAMRRVQP